MLTRKQWEDMIHTMYGAATLAQCDQDCPFLHRREDGQHWCQIEENDACGQVIHRNLMAYAALVRREFIDD